MKFKFVLGILLLIGVVYLFSMCSNNKIDYNNEYNTHGNYNINHYIDTIDGHIILTTVCNEIITNKISVSTLELKN